MPKLNPILVKLITSINNSIIIYVIPTTFSSGFLCGGLEKHQENGICMTLDFDKK